MISENGASHGAPRHAGDLFILSLYRGDLVFLFPLDLFVREGGVEQHVGQKFQSELQIGTHCFHGNTEAVVARVGADLSTHRFDLLVDVLRAPRCGALDQCACGQRRDAVRFSRLGEQAAPENGGDFDQGQFVVLADQDAQTVGQGEFLDPSQPGLRARAQRRGERTFRIERSDGQSGDGEILCGHALQLGRGYAGDLTEIFGAKVRIASEEPAAADIRGATARGGKIVQLVGEYAFAGFGHFRFRRRGLAIFRYDIQSGFFRLRSLFRFAEKIDAEESHFAGHVGISRYVVDEIASLAQLEVQRRAAPSAQHRGEHIKGRGVRMGQGRDVPDERTTGKLGLEFFVRLAAAHLRGFARDEERFARAALAPTEPFLGLVENILSFHVADHHEEHIVRHIALPVISLEIGAIQPIENIKMPDDWVAVGALAERSGKHQLGAHAVRIIESHSELAPDHFLLFGILRLGQNRMHRRIGQQLDGCSCALGRHIDPIDRAVKRRVGIDVTPGLLHGARDLVGSAFLRAFENHVLKQMRESRPQPAPFMDAAACHPNLHAGHWSGVVGLNQDGETVGQHAHLRLAAGQRGGRIGCGHEVGHCHERGRAARINRPCQPVCRACGGCGERRFSARAGTARRKLPRN